MIDFAIRYRAVIFTPTYDIEPKPDTLTYFIKSFFKKELIPSTYQEASPEGIVNRFGLKSNDEVWDIKFSYNRINILKINRDVGETEMKDLKTFSSEVKDTVNIILNKYPRKANRISLISEYFFEEMKEQEFNSIFSKLFNSISTHKKNVPYEWSQRCVSKVNKAFNGNEETLNFITEINKSEYDLMINSKKENLDRITQKYEINTFQGNTDYRFETDDIKSFYNNAVNWEDSMKQETLKLME